MSRIYIYGDEARFVRKDTCKVDVEFVDGTKLENLEPRRLFPVSGGDRYITLLDEENKEKALIPNLANLMPESREIIEDCLKEYYLVPKIIEVLGRSEKFGILKWTVRTDRGVVTFTILNRQHDIKLFYDGRILIRDSNDNRYEIENFYKLDKRSIRLLNNDI